MPLSLSLLMHLMKVGESDFAHQVPLVRLLADSFRVASTTTMSEARSPFSIRSFLNLLIFVSLLPIRPTLMTRNRPSSVWAAVL